MNVLILQGSPNRNGSTALLSDEFARGAREAGHAVERVDVAHAGVKPCTGCVACGYGAGPCVQRDGMEDLREKLLAADLIAFATPLYYFGMTAQLKAVIDRFCADNGRIGHGRQQAALLTVAWDSESWTFDALVAHYQALCKYVGLEDRGMVLGYGCGTPSMTRRSSAMGEAYGLGRSL